jgi:shikimate dehydrogenase
MSDRLAAAHSRSPLIHKYWLKSFGIDGDYRIEAVEPNAFAKFIASLEAARLSGRQCHHSAQGAGARADACGRACSGSRRSQHAYFDNDGELRSTNTDVEGFIGNLDASAPGWDGADDVLVLGAGGSARAVIFGLIERGIARASGQPHRVALAGAGGAVRRAGEAAGVGRDRRCAAARGPAGEHHIAGHEGQPPLEIDIGALPSGATVADLVYVPLETDLLKAARARSLKTADGLGMLLHQAVRGFELWFGKRPLSHRNCARWSSGSGEVTANVSLSSRRRPGP